MLAVVIFIFTILVASILQASTGFGFSILAMPFLLLLFHPAEAIQINLVLSLVISVALIAKVKRHIHGGVLKRLLLGSIIGLPFGMILFLLLDVPALKLGISAVILSLTVLLMMSFRVKQTERRDVLVGGLAGVLTTCIGMPGPPLLLYFAGTDAQKATIRSTTLAFYLVIYFLSIVFQVSFAGTTPWTWTASALALPLVFVGMYVGQLLFRWISERHFQRLLYAILAFTGLYLFVENIGLL